MRHIIRAAAMVVVLTPLIAAAPAPRTPKMSDTTPQPAAAPGQPSIGQATMEPDGTIILRLRAVSPGAIGDAMLRYPPNHPKYKSILEHLGGLQPGESKPVPPFD